MLISGMFLSIQGESTYQGLPCIFIRATGCNLRCVWCDTGYGKVKSQKLKVKNTDYNRGMEMSVKKIVEKVKFYDKIKLVEITGGEPLLQDEIYDLSVKLLNEGYKVLVETNGSLPIKKLVTTLSSLKRGYPFGEWESIVIIMDIKCPGSGMADKMHWENMKWLRAEDEVKFVIADKEDYEWAKNILRKTQKYNTNYRLKTKNITFQPVYGDKKLPKQMAKWILKDKLPVRLQVQLHKWIEVR